MIQLCKKNNEEVINAIKKGKADAADVGLANLIDTIVLKMINEGLVLTALKDFAIISINYLIQKRFEL